MQLSEYLNKGIKNISDTVGRFYLNNRKGKVFMMDFTTALYNSSKIRKRYEQKGTTVPPFLIASIASDCNLHCAGCFARANGACSNEKSAGDIGITEWYRIFTEASDLGISFIILAGGEPLLHRDIITMAAPLKKIVFPIFTNGMKIDEEYMLLFDNNRNLIPVLSIEGDEVRTNKLRGPGVAEKLRDVTKEFKNRGILYGVSITVTKENKDSVTESSFIRLLHEWGCGLVFFIEYVPVEEGTEHLVLKDQELQELQARIDSLRNDKQNKGMILLSFPGDEEAMGGCLAAGRGFFHISSSGKAEPCPFSPYSEIDLTKQPLLAALKSPFFEKVREISAAEAPNHKGGCTLFLHRNEVNQAMEAAKQKWPYA